MDQPTPERQKRALPVGRMLAAVVSIALVVFWVWIFTGGPARKNPDFLTDRAWVGRAEAICRRTATAIDELPGAETSANSSDRAVVVDQGSRLITRMIADMASRPPEDEQDTRLVHQWLQDYRSYVASRTDYARRLPTDPGARLLFNEKFHQPIDDVISTFADVNEMPSCEPPGDVA